ncbi:MAG: NifU family protein [Mycobacterium sp.]
MIAVHPERVAGDPDVVRWVVPPGILPVGRLRRAPGRLGEMLADGTLTGGLVEHTAVWLWAGADRSWSTLGAPVRSALLDALGAPGPGWDVEPAAGEVLQRVIADVLDGSVGDFVRSHGGSVSARRSGDTVALELGGACEHCPAATHTLRLRLQTALRLRCPDLVEVGSGGGHLVLALRSGLR